MGSRCIAYSEPWPHLEFDEFLPVEMATAISERWPVDGWKWLKHSDVVQADGTSLRRYQHFWKAFPEFAGDLVLDWYFKHAQALNVIEDSVYPFMLLVEDAPGYKIRRHTDCAGKRISAQVYLPTETGHEDHGVIFQTLHGEKSKQIPYRFNHGYAFKVTKSSWHRVAPATVTRRSLQLIYYDTPTPNI